jgi:hypothetical protein
MLAKAAPSPYSNAPFRPEDQSILSKIVAHWIWFESFVPSHAVQRTWCPPWERQKGR